VAIQIVFIRETFIRSSCYSNYLFWNLVLIQPKFDLSFKVSSHLTIDHSDYWHLGPMTLRTTDPLDQWSFGTIKFHNALKLHRKLDEPQNRITQSFSVYIEKIIERTVLFQVSISSHQGIIKSCCNFYCPTFCVKTWSVRFG
jgi:hypothetical protein